MQGRSLFSSRYYKNKNNMVDQLFNKIQAAKGKEVNVSSKLLGVEAKHRFIEAIQNGDVATVRKYLRFGLNPELLDDCNRPLFSLVCRAGFVDTVSEFLKCNVDINAASSDGQTALHVAVAKKHVDVIKLLLVSGASLTPKTLSGLKPIDLADYGSEIWETLKDAENGFFPEITSSNIPELEEISTKDTTNSSKPKEANTKDNKKKRKKD